MSGNASNHGKDSNGDWVPMGATTTGDNSPAGKMVIADNNTLYNTDGTSPKTETVTGRPRHLNDVNAYALHATQGAVVQGDLSLIEYTAGENVTAVLINAWGSTNFKGYYVTVNAPDAATAALRLASDNTTSKTDTLRYWCAADKAKLIKMGEEITSVYFIAIDTDASEDNNADIEPY